MIIRICGIISMVGIISIIRKRIIKLIYKISYAALHPFWPVYVKVGFLKRPLGHL
ncbi:hypothetical protein [Caldicellulosiruptor naganoensis]|uniref:Uncharacterized protein n=1 Tax=Caldicellulosiruptor naganoensis TaxID=29324 RepID=A0ABY7BEM7_9FIRM|nr:hypothetical protein [Caldicellulosiruptor naganoensis]WAM31283.1 hypothetical protein OTJ99_002129 [Caldicellulosiruptor naganoensis]